MATRQTVLGLYKRLMQNAALLEKPSQKFEAIGEIRATFKRNANKSDPETILSLINKGEQRLSYLKMQVPKSIGGKANQTYYVTEHGDVIEGTAPMRPAREFIDKRLDIEDLQRHQRLLDRQHFRGRNKPLRSELPSFRN